MVKMMHIIHHFLMTRLLSVASRVYALVARIERLLEFDNVVGTLLTVLLELIDIFLKLE